MSAVNLDALIKREDLFKLSDDESGLNASSDNKILRIDADLNPRKSHTFQTLRKADFQRETSEWNPKRIVGLVNSFIAGDIIPSIILWNWKGLNFVIDGGHRLSAIVAWITNDYGDKEISEAYFGAENITKAQRKNAIETRTLMDKEIGSFASIEFAFSNPDKVSEEQAIRARNILVTRSIQVQWINAKTSKDAENSFFRINGEATPIDETEAVILKSREKPNAISARAKEREQYARQQAVAFAEWFTRKDSMYAVMYGDQEERFADEDREYTADELYTIFEEQNKRVTI